MKNVRGRSENVTHLSSWMRTVFPPWGWRLFLHLSSFALIAVGMVLIIHRPLGLAAWEVLRFPRAALLLNPEPQLALTVGRYYFDTHEGSRYDPPLAKKYFERALELNAQTPGAWYHLARVAFVYGKYDEALQNINHEIALSGESFPPAYYMRGLTNGFLNRLDEAEDDFKKLIAIGQRDERFWAVYNDLAWVHFKKGDYKQAEIIAREGLRLYADNFWLLNALGVALLNQDKTKEAGVALTGARERAEALTEENMIRAYPGNDPREAGRRIEMAKEIVKFNLSLIGVETQKERGGKISSLANVSFRFASFSPVGPRGGLVIAACAFAAPTADIKANGSDGPITIAYNTAATISWSSTDATSCTVSPPGWTGTSNPGISTGALTSGQTYTLDCSGDGGSAADSVQVDVSPPPSPTADIKANGSDGPITIAYNTGATIEWGSANADSCTVSLPGWTGTSGSKPTGALISGQIYTLNCSGPGGSAADSVQVNVAPPVCNDIGLRVKDGTAVVRINTDPGSPLRIRKGSTTYGVQLVNPNNPSDPYARYASRIRIQTPAGLRALVKCP